MDSISTDTWCSASGAMTERAIFVTPAACTAAPLWDDTFSTSQVASATCRNSEGGSSAGRGRGPVRACGADPSFPLSVPWLRHLLAVDLAQVVYLL